MKHTVQVTAVLIAVFLIIQAFGLYALSQSMRITTSADGSVSVSYDDTAVGERPDIQGFASLLYILAGILIGTGLILFFVRLGQVRLWKVMYFFAVWLASTITLGVFASPLVAAALAAILALVEIFRTNVLIHNLTEVLIYPGIAILFVPLFNVYWAAILLVAISIYDMYAVWKSKHMVKLAKFQTSSKAFAGFVIPYSTGKGGGISSKIPSGLKAGGESKAAILGGGDIAFPLVFAGAVMGWLVAEGIALPLALALSMVVSAFSSLGLLYLFVRAEKDKFYPAMPFVTAGCFAGAAVVFLAMQLL